MKGMWFFLVVIFLSVLVNSYMLFELSNRITFMEKNLKKEVYNINSNLDARDEILFNSLSLKLNLLQSQQDSILSRVDEHTAQISQKVEAATQKVESANRELAPYIKILSRLEIHKKGGVSIIGVHDESSRFK